MATNTRGVLTTVQDVMNFMSPFAGGSVPAPDDEDYPHWLRWIQLGQQDAVNRGFWRRLLTKTTLTISAGAETTNLPANFSKVNGIYALFANGIDWSKNGNTDQVQLFVEVDPTNGSWRVRWLPSAPTTAVTADLWYFFNPPKPEAAGDFVILDGEMIGYYALKEYFRKLKQLGSLDDARVEYENRFRELLALEMMPSEQEMMGVTSYNSFLNKNPMDRNMYRGRTGRNRRGY